MRPHEGIDYKLAHKSIDGDFLFECSKLEESCQFLIEIKVHFIHVEENQTKWKNNLLELPSQ